ncbi:MAG: hypothetical protein ACKVVT_06740 [Dehalococcoidia bacterium]
MIEERTELRMADFSCTLRLVLAGPSTDWAKGDLPLPAAAVAVAVADFVISRAPTAVFRPVIDESVAELLAANDDLFHALFG